MLEILLENQYGIVGQFLDSQEFNLTNKISKENYFSTKDVLIFLISNNMVGAIWSPKHLFCLMNLLFKEKLINLNIYQKLEYFTSISKSAIEDYKTLTFEEIFNSKEELEASINKKVSSYFRISAKFASWDKSCSHLKSVEDFCLSEWIYMKNTLGAEIQM